MFRAAMLKGPFVFWSVIALAALASLPMRFGGATPDISWLITMCERILNGEIAYVDIFETTPPTPTLLYMPGVLLSRVTPLSAEAAVYITAYLSTLATLALSALILPPRLGDAGDSRWLIIFPSAVFLFLLTNDAFAQREYFAAIFVLPVICVFVAHAQEKRWPGFQARLWAALLAGLSVAIKPPVFAVPGLLLGAWYLYETKTFRTLYSSGLIAGGAIGVVVTAISLAAFPDYLKGVTALMRDVYVPTRLPVIENIFGPAFISIVSAGAAIAVLSLDKKLPKAVTMMLIAAAGYIVLYAVQGKFFDYHLLPGSFLVFIALFTLATQRLLRDFAGKATRMQMLIVPVAIVGVVSLMIYRGFDDHRPQITDFAWAKSLERPTAMAISPYINTGFPLARQIDAVWIDRIHSQWVANYTRVALGQIKDQSSANAERMRAYHERDLERTRALIREERPELVIQAVADSVSWLNEEMLENDPALLDDYDVIAEEGAFRIWRRRDAIASN